MAAKDHGSLAEFDRLVLHQAVTVVALELLRRRVADETERRLAGDILSAVLSGELTGSEVARRLEPFGVRERVGVLVLSAPRAARAAVEDAVAEALREDVGGGLIGSAGQLSCVLVPLARADEESIHFGLAERAARPRRAGRRAGGRRRGGAAGGARRAAPRLPRGALRARGARDRGPDGNGDGAGGGRLATYRDLGSFQLLLSLQDDDALRLFCDSILAPIEEGEGAYGGELMRSLETFIECNGQWERAARQLFCHRHTLRYRIRRVEELTGRSLDSARDRIDFWLALRGRELVG